jgi:hypothetical protein
MMNCAQVQRDARRSFGGARPASAEARRHLDGCRGCREALKYDILTAELMRSYATPGDESEVTPSPFFLTRLRGRLDAERRERGLSPWESAVMAARGWLLAFAAVVAVMCAVSLSSLRDGPGQLDVAGDLNAEVLALPPGTENILIANGESLSNDAVLSTLVNEENNHGRK